MEIMKLLLYLIGAIPCFWHNKWVHKQGFKHATVLRPGISPGLTAQVAGFVMIFGLLRTLRLNYRVKVTPGVTGLKVC
jgi:hypothetical protein